MSTLPNIRMYYFYNKVIFEKKFHVHVSEVNNIRSRENSARNMFCSHEKMLVTEDTVVL